MATLIDESGDFGVHPRSPRFYRITAVCLPTEDLVNEYLLRINTFNSDSTAVHPKEFHFAKIGHAMRLKFYKIIQDLPFAFVCVSFDKDRKGRGRLKSKFILEDIIETLTSELVEIYKHLHNSGIEVSELVRFDECNDADYNRALKTHFGRINASWCGSRRLIKSVKPGRSRSDPLLQLADMVSGAACRHFDGDDVYFDKISHNYHAVISK